MKHTLTLLTALLLAPSAALHAAEPSATFCNPLPIPNYPVGLLARNVTKGQPDADRSWLLGYREQFRELGEPTALWHEGKWYLYPSVHMAWVSADNGATWQHHPLNVQIVGCAPTLVRHRGQFLLCGNGPEIFASSSPLGPFKKIGDFPDVRSAKAPPWEKMLFSDDDGRLYLYFGITEAGGIWGMELDAADPTKALSEPVELFTFDPQKHPWEAWGEWNQDTTKGWLEGAWMLKRNGRYYLTYSAAGAANRTYALGCYVGSSPLGPFQPQAQSYPPHGGRADHGHRLRLHCRRAGGPTLGLLQRECERGSPL